MLDCNKKKKKTKSTKPKDAGTDSFGHSFRSHGIKTDILQLYMHHYIINCFYFNN